MTPAFPHLASRGSRFAVLWALAFLPREHNDTYFLSLTVRLLFLPHPFILSASPYVSGISHKQHQAVLNLKSPAS